MGDEIEGFRVVAACLKNLGVTHMFGVVGIPVVEVAVAAQQEGIEYIGMRNEQAACYAAQAWGYLTGWPAACLAVSGPGLLHCIAGLANAKENCWPMVLLGGSCDTNHEGVGGFQEFHQMEAVAGTTKYRARPSSVELIGRHLERAVRASVYGRPGPTYIDLPGDLLNSRILESSLVLPAPPPPPPAILPPQDLISSAVDLLKKSKSPLIIVGKGAAYSRAEDQVRSLTNTLGIPVLATPMGKGVLPDSSPLLVGSARSAALAGADTVLLLGARLNWMLHYGTAPRWKTGVKIIQVDLCAEELHNSIPATVAIQGDLRSTVAALSESFGGWSHSRSSQWWSQLREACAKNEASTKLLAEDSSQPLNYYAAFAKIKDEIKPNTYVVSEGANTMDIGRVMMGNELPRHRLDAGTFGTMGLGPAFAIATALYIRKYDPGARVLCVEGDSAFGFSGMEFETMARYQLPILTVIFNNSGIYSGFDKEVYDDVVGDDEPGIASPATALLPQVRYERLAEMVGLTGEVAKSQEEVEAAVASGLVRGTPSIVNVIISPTAGRKAQAHEWLTRAKL